MKSSPRRFVAGLGDYEAHHIRRGRSMLTPPASRYPYRGGAAVQGHPNKRAIVIGASMGGLLAARVLADFYNQVTVVERDALPDEYEPRKGVPQGRHAHGLLSRGREVLEQLFPGFTEEMVSQGATSGDIAD